MLSVLTSYYKSRHLWLAGTLLILLSIAMLGWMLLGLSLSSSRSAIVPVATNFLVAVLPGVIGLGFILKKGWAWWLFLIALVLFVIWFIRLIVWLDPFTYGNDYKQMLQATKQEYERSKTQ